MMVVSFLVGAYRIHTKDTSAPKNMMGKMPCSRRVVVTAW